MKYRHFLLLRMTTIIFVVLLAIFQLWFPDIHSFLSNDYVKLVILSVISW